MVTSDAVSSVETRLLGREVSYVVLAGLLVWGTYAAYTALTGAAGPADDDRSVGTGVE